MPQLTEEQARQQLLEERRRLAETGSALPPTPVPQTGSIVDYLTSRGEPSDFASRTARARDLGIEGYTGTAEQNLQMLSMLRQKAEQPRVEVPTLELPVAEEAEVPEVVPEQTLGRRVSEILQGFGISPPSMEKPAVSSFSEIYRQVFDQYGLGGVQQQISDLSAELEEEENKLNDQIADINENPWLSEPVRQTRVQNAKNRFDDRVNTRINRLRLLQGTLEGGRQEAQFLAQGILSEQQRAESIQQDLIMRAIDIAEREAQAERELELRAGEPATADIAEYEFYKSQGGEGSFLDFLRDRAAVQRAPKAGVGGIGVGGQLSTRAQAVFQNPSLLGNYTPTEKGQILDELAAAGADLSRFAIANLTAGQREQIALFDEIENEALFAQQIYEQGIDTGPIAGRVERVRQLFGTGEEAFTNLDSAISNMGSILLRMRSGAAVTPQEFERIKGFIPAVTEDEKTAQIKVGRFFEAINEAKDNYINRNVASSFDILEGQQVGFAEPPTGSMDDIKNKYGVSY